VNKVVFVILAIAAIAVFVFLAIVEMARLALQEAQRRIRLCRRVETQPLHRDCRSRAGGIVETRPPCPPWSRHQLE
jgi:hypothetical protein